MKLDDLIGKKLHVQFAQPARVKVTSTATNTWRVDGVDAVLRDLASGYATFEVTLLFGPDFDNGECLHLDDVMTLMHPIKHLGSVQVL